MKTKFNQLFTGLALASVLVLSLSSCSKDEDETAATASLTIVNTIDGSAAQDVYLNDSKVSTVAYASGATSVNTTTATRNIAFKNSGTTNATATATINVDANSSQSVFLVKKADGNYDVNTYANDNTAVSGKAKVRFINVAPLLAGAINVTTTTGTSIVSAIAFRTASAYQTVDAATALNINMSGSIEVTTISNTELQAGKVYTVWFDSATTTKVKYHVILQN